MKPAELWRPYETDFMQNPYPIYHKIRKQASIFKANSGDYVVMGYKLCRDLLSSEAVASGTRSGWLNRFSKEAAKRGYDFKDLEILISRMLINMNGDLHLTERKLISSQWPSREKLEQIVQESIQSINWDQTDYANGIARELPLAVISKILGLPLEESRKYMQDGFNLVQVLDPYLSFKYLIRIDTSARRLYGFMKENLLNLKIANHPDIPQEERIFVAIFLFIAGYETTSGLLSQCIYQLSLRKELMDRLDNDDQIEIFINEVQRLYTPVQLIGRITTKDITVEGLDIPAGSTLTFCLASANRDEAVFEEGDSLSLKKKKKKTLTFGYGIHHCIGESLALMEAKYLVKSFMQVAKKFRLKEEPGFVEKFTIRSITSLNFEKIS